MFSPGDPSLVQEYLDLANAMPNLVWVSLPDGTVVYYNDRIYDFEGCYKHDDGSWSWDAPIHPGDVEKTLNTWKHCIATGERYEIEHRLLLKTGEYRWFLTRAVAKYGEDGKIVRWYGTATDVHQQKEIERALRASEAETRAAFENSSVGMAQVDPFTKKFLRVNPAFCSLVGYTRDELMTMAFLDITHPEDRGHDLDLFEKMVRGESKEYQSEKRYIRKDGEVVWGIATANLIFDEEGKPKRTNAIIRDVTRKKKAEDALLDSEVKFKAFLHDSPLVAWSKDEQGRYVYLNNSYEKRFGVSLEEWKGRTDFEIRPPEIAKIFWDNDLKVLRSGEPIMEVEYVIEDGEPSYWQSFKFVYQDTEGHKYVGGIGYDITRQRLAEQASKKAMEQLDLTFRNVPVGILLFDKDRKLVFANDLGAQFAGFDSAVDMMNMVNLSDVRNRSKAVFDVYDDEGVLQTPENSPVQRSFRSKAGTFGVYSVHYRESGKVKWIYYACNPLLNDEGEVEMVISTVTDVTAQREAENMIIKEQKDSAGRLEKLVAQRTRELQESNESLQQFAHVASHDLKEPVRKIKIFGNRILEEYGSVLPERARTYLEKIESAANRMYIMIDGVLKFSALDATQHNEGPVDLNLVLESIEADLELLIQTKEATIEKRNLPVVNGISVLLHQLFYNLINNSLKFSRQNVPPRICVEGSMELVDGKQYFKVEVTDNGIGFEKENAVKIFNTFTRLHPKDIYEGTGLGLALCRKIAERHHGWITANSEPGQGAVFTVMLPAEPTTPASLSEVH